MARNIVIGQKVKSELVARAKQFRREQTPEEKILWERLRNNQLGGFHFRRQQIIGEFIVDFYCHQASVVVETDGGIHAQFVERDRERDAKISARDLLILRFKNDQVRNDLATVLQHILKACRERI